MRSVPNSCILSEMMNTDDLRISRTRPLLAPAILAEDIPRTQAASDLVQETRSAIEKILSGRDQRLLVIVGPCSIHDLDAAREYAMKLQAFADTVAERLMDREAGHAAQNLLLATVALGLASVPVGGFDPQEAGRLLALPPGEEVLYLIPVGHGT